MKSYEQEHELGTTECIQDRTEMCFHHLVKNTGVPSLADTFGRFQLSCAFPAKYIRRNKIHEEFKLILFKMFHTWWENEDEVKEQDA